MKYLANAFSLQMLDKLPASVEIIEINRDEINFNDYKSVVGHEDTARLLKVQFNRESIHLGEGDELIVAQLQGGRLPEGTKELPEGYTFKFLRVTIK